MGRTLPTQGGLCLFYYVLDNLNWLVFFVQFNNQLDVEHKEIVLQRPAQVQSLKTISIKLKSVPY